jgi:alkylation response protein AidB-like acyl-CoA dehydrogenase
MERAARYHPTQYHPTQEQLAIAGEVSGALEELLPLSRLHTSQEESDATWASLAELGVFGITVDESRGGSGLGAAEEALIVMTLGRHLVSAAVVATIGALHADEFAVSPLAAADERVAAAYLHGDRIIKVAEKGCRHLLVRRPEGARLVSDDASVRLNDRLWLADLHWAMSVGKEIASFDEERTMRLCLLDAALLVGVAEAALSMAVAYAGVRQQFGRSIGSFQAVKHHCANMALAARRARDQTSFAAVAVDAARSDARLQVECAFFTAGTAALEAAATNIQIHGGIGFSDEADPHLLLKRAQLYVSVGGGLEAASERISDIAPVL